jgi:hypothetical protein
VLVTGLVVAFFVVICRCPMGFSGLLMMVGGLGMLILRHGNSWFNLGGDNAADSPWFHSRHAETKRPANPPFVTTYAMSGCESGTKRNPDIGRGGRRVVIIVVVARPGTNPPQ